MNTLSWVGVGLMALAAVVGCGVFAIREIRGVRRGYWIRETAELVRASSGFVRSVTILLKTPYGFPALVFLGGFVVLIIGQATRY
jgi:hypothetical protein